MRIRNVLLLFAALVCVSCSTTGTMVSGEFADRAIPFEEKLEKIPLKRCEMSDPEIIRNGNRWLEKATDMVSQAEDYIIATSFLASNCSEMAGFYDALVKKAEEGVDVYFLVDGVGLFDMTESRFHLVPLTYLNDTPVHFLEFSPMSTARLISGINMMERYHQKVLIIDGKEMAIGGMNYNYISSGASGSDLQRDSMYIFRSPGLIREFTLWFREFWNSYSWDRIPRDRFTVCDDVFSPDEQTIDAYPVNQLPESDLLARTYSSLISSAESEILILPFLPALDSNMLSALENAVQRGVDVKMVLAYDERTCDRWMFKKLLDIGVDLRFDTVSERGMLHEKLMVVDRRYTLFGSMNFNYRSLNLAYENCVLADSPALAERERTHFKDLFAGSDPVKSEDAEKDHNTGTWLRHLVFMFGG